MIEIEFERHLIEDGKRPKTVERYVGYVKINGTPKLKEITNQLPSTKKINSFNFFIHYMSEFVLTLEDNQK